MSRLRDYLYVLLAIVVVSAAIAIVSRPPTREGEIPVSLDQARQIFPEARELSMTPDEVPTFVWAKDSRGERLGSLVITSPYTDRIIGYAGPVPLLIGIGPDDKIVGVEMLPNYETPSYMRLLFSTDFMERWNGLYWREAARETGEVDAVSSVTITCLAIARTLRHRLAMIDPEARIAPPRRFRPEMGLLDVAMIFLAIVALLMVRFPARFPKWTRLVQHSVSIVVLGVLATSMISMALLAGWLRSATVAGSAGILVVVALALLAPIVLRRNFYCRFLCPFGAAQEIAFHLAPISLKPGPRLHRGLRWVRYGVLTFAGLTLLFGLGLDLNDLEPFSAFRPKAAGLAALAIGSVALLASSAIRRPWCTYACGTGALLDSLRRPRLASNETSEADKPSKTQETT